MKKDHKRVQSELNVRQVGDSLNATRKYYVPPQIEESAEFETLALACGKLSGRACVSGGGLGGS